MRSPSDPIRTAWIQTLVVGGVGLVACALAVIWAFKPAERTPVDLNWQPALEAPGPRLETAERTGQMAVFEKRLWTPPEKPVEVAAENAPSALPPPSPPRLVLLGIVSPAESGLTDYEAILYDPDTDTIHIARSGAAIGPVTVGSVTSETADLVTPDGQTRLRLDTGRLQATQG